MDFKENWRRRKDIEPQVEEVPDRTHFVTVLVQVEDEDITNSLRQAQDKIRGFDCVDTVPKDYFHVTVKLGGFLVDDPTGEDELGQEDLEKIRGQVEAIVETHDTFELELENLNLFPSVVFAEVHDMDGELESLHNDFQQINEVMESPHAYLPHLTLSHFQSQKDFGEMMTSLEKAREQSFGKLEVEELCLVRDDLEDYSDLENDRNFEVIERFEL